MTEKAISPLRRRLIEDMAIRRLSPKTHYQYIRHVKKFADFLGRSADKATVEDVHRYQLWLASIGTTVGTANVSATEAPRHAKPALFANANRANNIALARRLLGVPDPSPPSADSDGTENLREGSEWNACPCCGGRMVTIETFKPGCQPRLWPRPSIGLDSS